MILALATIGIQMPKKICQVIFSTNRIEYLTTTLKSLDKLDCSGFEVDRIFIDDFPKGRNDRVISTLVKAFGFHEQYLHTVNKGLTVTWTEFWNLIRDRNYDYVWHMEDDIEIVEPVPLQDLVDLLEQDPDLSQVKLERQAWYWHEKEPEALDTDWTFKNYRYRKGDPLFSLMASLYSMDRVRCNYGEWFAENCPGEGLENINYNEGMVGLVLANEFKKVSGVLKTQQGKNMVRHIGEYCVGQRVLPNEPNYEQFAKFDPEKRYYSSTGEAYPE
jgi:hypothetical protein